MASAVAASVQNLDEAANLASDLITNLDNLPNEVQHLLNEIRLKDRRCQELQQDIAKDQAKYIKYSLRQDPAFPSFAQIGSKLNGAAGETPQGEVPQVSTQNKPVPKAHLPARIAASYVEIDALSNEKVTLVQRIIDLITRTRARVDANLAHVQVLQGESVSTPYNARRPEGMSGSLNLVVQSGEGVLRALTTRTGSADSIVPSTPPATVSGPPYNKKRRITTTTSIKLQSPAPSTPQVASAVSYPKSRLSRQVQLTRSQQQQQQQEEDLDADAEGEEDLEGEDAEDDLTPYCFCHKPSFGDMIGCDNLDCPYQWFHISCVGVKTPLPDKWYCPECVKNRTAVPERRKGRKK
ncbi:hypothetical protein K443DRAFT_677024 [Laccaria amethystina LaAM-08-1]|uniref:Chromatin modification-related protein n=1 Tax=Laccaria amethystina LaAM-08-1 TaxID=1095629 RepID=A0A0C9XE49_9AGAR|nr:hypothetical protein K443DRAFT_677024 [Laccaria amethystina LaAM-08-1]